MNDMVQRQRRWAVGAFVLSCIIVLFGGSSAVAQSEPSAQDQARVLVEEAGEEFQAGRYDEAAILFQRAYNLDPHPVILFNLARAHQEMGDLPTALQLFESLVAMNPSGRALDAAQSRIADIRDSLTRQGYDPDTVSALEYVPRGEVRIESDPLGAAVFLDNEFVGITPYEGQLLRSGEASLRLELEGYHPISAEIAIPVGARNTRAYTLAERAGLASYVPPTPGYLNVRGPAPGLSVAVDGTLRGLTPLEGVRLPPGEYLVEVSGEGWETYVSTVEVETAGEAYIFATMDRVAGFDEGATAGLRRGGTSLIAVGGAGLVVGAILAGVANGNANDYNARRSDPDRGALRDAARRQALGADLSFMTGAAALGTGVALRVVAAKRRDRWSRDLLVMPSVDPRGRAAVHFTTRF